MRRPRSILSLSLSKGLLRLVKKKRVEHFEMGLKPRFELKDQPRYLRLFDQLQWINIGNGNWK